MPRAAATAEQQQQQQEEDEDEEEEEGRRRGATARFGFGLVSFLNATALAYEPCLSPHPAQVLISRPVPVARIKPKAKEKRAKGT